MNKKLTNIIIAGVVATSVTQGAIAHHKTNELQQKQIELQKKYNDSQSKVKSLNNELKIKENELKNIKREKKSLESEIKELKESATKKSIGEPVTMTLTFYGDSKDENGGYAGIDARGESLTDGTVASNVYDFGTEFVLNGKTYTVKDRGGHHFNSPNRLDVFVERRSGESDDAYEQRISNKGKVTVTMYKR